MSINGRKSFYIWYLMIQKFFFGRVMSIAIQLAEHEMHVSHFTDMTL
jgi:hypothetical protein